MNLFLAGLLPFSSIFIELNFVANAVWGNYTYHLYGVLIITLILFIITVACTSIALTYF